MRQLDILNQVNEVQPLTQLKEEELRFKKQVKTFAESYVRPLIYQMDEQEKLDPKLIQNLFEHNLMNIEIPKIFGGEEKSFFSTILAIEELAKVDPAIAVFIDVQNTLVNYIFKNCADDEQKKYFLPKLARNTVGSFSITEKEAGSDAYALASQAEEVDGGYLLNGEKHWATNAAEAGIIIIFAKLHSQNSNDALTAFIVERENTPNLMVKAGDCKMGIRASSTCDIFLENVFVPRKNLLGGIGRGRRIAIEALTNGRIGIAAQMLGLAEGAFNECVEYSQKRKQFGKYIAGFQGVNFQIAEMAAEIEATRLLVYNAARIREVSKNFSELFTTASIAKFYASKVAEKVASKALDVVSGVGYIKGNPIEKFYRDAKIGKIYEGTTNIQLRSIARKYLRIKVEE